MFGITEEYEKWMDRSLFFCPIDDRFAALQLIHMKCFALTMMKSCCMNILVVNVIQRYLIGILGFCGLMTLVSPHLIWKAFPIILMIISFYVPYIRRNDINFRYGAFYLYCLICCLEVQGFEFLFDLYLIVCYVIETFYSCYSYQRYNVLSALVCEFGIWTVPCSLEFKMSATFCYLAIEAYNYPEIWGISTFYVTLGIAMFAFRVFEMDLQEHLEDVRQAAAIIYEFFIANASLVVVPEKRKFYK